MNNLRAEQMLAGRYRLLHRIGQGDTAVVWRARDEVSHRLVAVKVLVGRRSNDADHRAGVRAAAQAARSLAHPHAAAVHDYVEEVDDAGRRTMFIVLELVDGTVLADQLARHGPLGWPAAARLCAQVAEAVAAAHRLRVTHGRLDARHVMLAGDDAKVLGFGGVAHTGSPPDADGAADVPALAGLLYECLTGRPFGRPDGQVVDAPAPRLPDVPGLPTAVHTAYRDCLSPDPAARPTAGQVATALRAASTADVAPAGPLDVVAAPTSGGRWRTVSRVGTVAGLGAALITAVLWRTPGPGQTRPAPPVPAPVAAPSVEQGGEPSASPSTTPSPTPSASPSTTGPRATKPTTTPGTTPSRTRERPSRPARPTATRPSRPPAVEAKPQVHLTIDELGCSEGTWSARVVVLVKGETRDARIRFSWPGTSTVVEAIPIEGGYTEILEGLPANELVAVQALLATPAGEPVSSDTQEVKSDSCVSPV